MLRTSLRPWAAASALALLVTGGANFASAAEPSTYTVGLHNTSAEPGTCPADIGTAPAWHFVAPPKSATDFQEITLYLSDGTTTHTEPIASWLEEPLTGDAYVTVPTGYTLDSLVGGLFVYTSTSDKANAVRLSHTCNADQPKYERLQVSKTAATTYNRAHDWDVTKSASPSTVNLTTDGAGDTTVTYDVGVKYLGATDSGWTVSGGVTITNNGDLPATLVSVVDTMTLNGVDISVPLTCEPDADGVFSVGETMECTYSKAVDGATAGTNKVVVTTEVREYSGTANVAWGAPANVSNASVTLTDVGGLTGTRAPQVFNAPADLQPVTFPVSYSKLVKWTDYGQAKCGNGKVYNNTASLSSGATAGASVTVNVQCFVFKGETAWGNGSQYPTADWSMYTAYPPATSPVDLIAGQHYDAGDITFAESADGKSVTITVALQGDWAFKNVKENLKVQGYKTEPTNVTTVIPGKFANKMKCDVNSSTCSITVAKASYYGIHVEVGRWIPDPKF